jgi:hypothetical protein
MEKKINIQANALQKNNSENSRESAIVRDIGLSDSEILGISTEQKQQEEQEEGKVKEETDEKEGNKKFKRILHMFLATIIGCIFLFATVFLEKGSTSEIFGYLPNFIINDGEITITFSSKETFSPSRKQAIFGGETISVQKGNAEIQFADYSLIRMQEGAEITIKKVFPYPIVSHKKGKIWILSQEYIEVEYENAKFFPRGFSGEFFRKDNTIAISAHRHPLFGEIRPEEFAERTNIGIPPQKKITFTIGHLPPTLANLHYSKLKKELRLTSIRGNEWISENILFDLKWISQKYEQKNTNSAYHEEDSFFENMENILTLYPKKSVQNKIKNKENKEEAFLGEYIFGSKNEVPVADISSNVLSTALALANIIPQDAKTFPKIKRIISEVKKRNDISNSEIYIAQTLLSTLEDALQNRDERLTSQIMEQIVSHWKNAKETEKNKRMLEIYREIIADVIRKNRDQFTVSFFLQTTILDVLALSWEKEEQIVVSLEIVERNLETVEAFLQRGDFERAKEILSVNRDFLEIRPSAKFSTAYKNILEKQEFLEEKKDIFRERGVISEERLLETIKKKEEAKEVIKRIQKTQQEFLQDSSQQEEESEESREDIKSLVEQIQEDFSAEEVVIISMSDIDENTKKVFIREAMLPDGSLFSAEYLPLEKVIRNINIQEEEITITGEMLLKNVVPALHFQRENTSTLEDVANTMQEKWHVTKDDPLKNVDPLIIDVTKRLVVTELTKRDFKVLLRNVTMISDTILRVESVKIADIERESFSFYINIKEAVVFDIMTDGLELTVPDSNLKDLRENILKSYQAFMEEVTQKKSLELVLVASGINIESSDIKKTSQGFHFQNGTYGDWNIAGFAEPKNALFLVIVRDGEPLFQNLAFDLLKEEIRKKWAEENTK